MRSVKSTRKQKAELANPRLGDAIVEQQRLFEGSAGDPQVADGLTVDVSGSWHEPDLPGETVPRGVDRQTGEAAAGRRADRIEEAFLAGDEPVWTRPVPVAPQNVGLPLAPPTAEPPLDP